MSKQSKKARFAAGRRWERVAKRITKANANKPGFVGVSKGLRVGRLKLGFAAIFIGQL